MSRFRRLLPSSPEDKDEIRRLRRLQEVSKALNSELDFQRLLDLIMDVAVELAEAERGFMILERDGGLHVAAARNIDREKIVRPEFKISRSIAEGVMASGKAVLSHNALDDSNLSVFSSVMTLKLKSVICVPLRRRDSVIGSLYLDHRHIEGRFTERDLELLATLSDHAAIALENSRLYQENLSARTELERVNLRLEEELRVRKDELEAVRARLEEAVGGSPLRHDYTEMVGESAPLRRVFELLDRIVETDLPVLVQGESGTGKELVARFLHEHGPRQGQRFVTLNCGAIPESLLESELFGAARGAFTGASENRSGILAAADGGTLFLDEISELSPALQAKLLRVLQEGEVRPVGSTETFRIDVRIVSATNRDLEAMVAEGAFREDLYFRLKGIVVGLPPLRDRKEDLPLLVDHFLKKIVAARPGSPSRISPTMLRILHDHSWPGNVRELENEIRRLSALSDGSVIDDPTLLRELLQPRFERDGDTAAITLRDLEREAIALALEKAGGNRARAARELGIPRRTLYDKLRRYGLGRREKGQREEDKRRKGGSEKQMDSSRGSRKGTSQGN